MQQRQIKIDSIKIWKILFGISVVLCLLSTAFWYLPRKFQFNPATIDELLYLDYEYNIPTYFSVLILLLASILTFFIAKLTRKNTKSYHLHWMGLSIGFLVMSADEFMTLHEKLTRVFYRFIGIPKNDFFKFSWVFLGILCFILIGLLYIKFLISLPNRTRWIFILAGIVYFLGVIGFEMISSYLYINLGTNNREYVVIITIEEFFEMNGVILFIYGLVDYIDRNIPNLSFQLLSKNKNG